ncbi:hypothetical protein RFI_00594, partial [Reticulomyxa filosa]
TICRNQNEMMKSNKKQKIQILQRGRGELNDENIWKESKKTRKDYFCKVGVYKCEWKRIGVADINSEIRWSKRECIYEEIESTRFQELDNNEKQVSLSVRYSKKITFPNNCCNNCFSFNHHINIFVIILSISLPTQQCNWSMIFAI